MKLKRKSVNFSVLANIDGQWRAMGKLFWHGFISPKIFNCNRATYAMVEWKIDVSLNYPAQTIRQMEGSFLFPADFRSRFPDRTRNFKVLWQTEERPEGAPTRSYEFVTVGEYVRKTFKEKVLYWEDGDLIHRKRYRVWGYWLIGSIAIYYYIIFTINIQNFHDKNWKIRIFIENLRNLFNLPRIIIRRKIIILHIKLSNITLQIQKSLKSVWFKKYEIYFINISKTKTERR